MRDVFTEIWASLRRNKLRTCLTGFAVSWGIFIVILLMGAGNGLIHSFVSSEDSVATNVVDVRGNVTSKPYAGMKEGRRISLDNKDVEVTGSELFAAHIDKVVASVSTSAQIVYGNEHIAGRLTGNYPDRQEIDRLSILHGRFINQNDIAQKRKVVVLPEFVVEELLGLTAPEGTIEEDPAVVEAKEAAKESFIGEYVKFSGIPYRVVGICKTDYSSSANNCFAPFTTVQAIYARGNRVDQLTFTFHNLPTEAANEEFEKAYRAVLNSHHNVAPSDTRAIRIDNQFLRNLQMNKVQKALHFAFLFIGLLTLIGGVVGVGNIMLITVKERTHEFGIRKSIGARPWSVMKLILAESITITGIFGYLGMLLGMVGCQVLDKTVGQTVMVVADQKIAVLVNPTVGLDAALEVTVVLVVAGLLAGLIPAYRAAKVRPIEALRAE
ncbi:MAG: ABC transporter permease [Bacteroidales bacterium]|nr:ABC transporter permease [Bacteroidales bacterium]